MTLPPSIVGINVRISSPGASSSAGNRSTYVPEFSHKGSLSSGAGSPNVVIILAYTALTKIHRSETV